MSQRRLKCTEAFGKEAPLLPCKQAQGDSAQRVCFSNSLALQGRLNNTKQPRQTSIQSCLRMEVLLRMSEYAVSRHPLILQDWLVVQSSSHQGAGFRTSRSSGASIPTTRFCGLVASMGEEGAQPSLARCLRRTHQPQYLRTKWEDLQVLDRTQRSPPVRAPHPSMKSNTYFQDLRTERCPVCRSRCFGAHTRTGQDV